MWSFTWPITRGVGSSSGTNNCFQIQPLFRRRCRIVDPWANCWASRPWVALVSLSTPPGIIEKTVTTAKTLGVLIFTVHACISSALAMASGQLIEVSLLQFIHQHSDSWSRQCCVPSCYDDICVHVYNSEIKVNISINVWGESFPAVKMKSTLLWKCFIAQNCCIGTNGGNIHSSSFKSKI